MNLSSLLIDISQKIGKKLEFTDQTLHGALNNNWVIKDEEEKKYVLRIPKGNPKQLPILRREYEGIGYVRDGSEYRLRDLEEQASFTETCRKRGIPVPQIIFTNYYAMLREYIEGITLENFLKTNNSTVIQENFLTLARAHAQNIVLGDRWGPNEIVTQDKSIVYIDFDIALKAKDAKEFEITQALYYAFLYAKDKEEASASIRNFIETKTFSSLYNKKRVSEFLEGHMRYFYNTKYGCIESHLKPLLASLQ